MFEDGANLLTVLFLSNFQANEWLSPFLGDWSVNPENSFSQISKQTKLETGLAAAAAAAASAASQPSTAQQQRMEIGNRRRSGRTS